MRLGNINNSLWLLLAAVLSATGVWLFAEQMVPLQIADDIAHDRPRGNLSDLYPRWLGARELLLHGRDPYSSAVTREIQEGFYGRPLDPVQPGDPQDQEGFAYPVYVVFYLAPTVHLPFKIVRKQFFWLLLGLTIATVPLWLRALRWRVSWATSVSFVILTVGSLPASQGLKLQQMTLLVVALLAAAMALLVSGWPLAAGILLALATIKPQLVWFVVIWWTIWTLADIRHRYRWAASFLLTMALLLVASEWYLPHWIPRFLQAVREYTEYTGAASTIDRMLPRPWGLLLGILTAGATLQVCWKNRKFAQDTSAFAAANCLVLAMTVILTPVSNYALYNQVLLLPAVLMLARERQQIWGANRVSRLLLSLTAILLLWPWLTNVVLSALSFVLPLEVVHRAWVVPFWTVLPFPLAVAAMVLNTNYQRRFATDPVPGAS